MDKEFLDVQREVASEIDDAQKTLRAAADGNKRIAMAARDYRSAMDRFMDSLDDLEEQISDMFR